MEGLEDAYNRGRIFIKKLDKMKGYQFFWGSAAYMYIDESTVNNYMNGNKKLALITLAHEGSHYTYATRNGILSGWWLEYEVEGYRINDILNLELNDKTPWAEIAFEKYKKYIVFWIVVLNIGGFHQNQTLNIGTRRILVNEKQFFTFIYHYIM